MQVTNLSEKFEDIKIAKGIFFEDDRGSLKKTIYGDNLDILMSSIKGVICSRSNKNVIRGLHFQTKPAEISKFITCVSGKIIDVFLDIRVNSKTFGQYASIELQENDDTAIFIPKGFAHGYGVLSKEATVVYLQSGNFDTNNDFAINPLSLGIDWGIKDPKISSKDANAISFQEFKKNIN